MSRELNPTQAFWLGHLAYAAALQMPLSAYAKTQTVTLADLMTWEKRLLVQGFPCHRVVVPHGLSRWRWSHDSTWH